MEQKTNIAELLKDCPKGTKLYSPLFGEVEFDCIEDGIGIKVDVSNGCTEIFYSNGRYYNGFTDAECLLFPSKDQRDWSKFQRPFKDGDILISGEGKPFIFKQINSFGNAECYCAINCYGELIFNSYNWTHIKGCRLATPKEKEKLFDAIKAKDYKWNAETKTLEKLVEPKFKDGDRVVKKGDISTPVSIVRVGDKYYYHYSNTEGTIGLLPIAEQDDWELVPNKFDATTLKPFDKVLVRDDVGHRWRAGFYRVGCASNYTIPYEGNEHLLGTTNDCDERFKTW